MIIPYSPFRLREGFLLGLVTILGCLSYSPAADIYGPKCLSCQGVTSPFDCLQTKRCWAHEDCFSERLVNVSGIPWYNFGCKIKEECRLLESLSEARARRIEPTVTLCERCCQGDACNTHLCSNVTGPSSVSCFYCENTDDPASCHVVKHCDSREVPVHSTVKPDHVRSTTRPVDRVTTTGTPVISSTDSNQLQGIRLVGLNSSRSGRLEVYHNGQWGTVCDDKFDVKAAKVACRQLGFPEGNVTYILSNTHLPGTGLVWLDNVVCNSTESSLELCAHNRIGVNNCQHYADVVMQCGEDTAPFIRLVNGSSPREGRIEVKYQGEWGTVCDDGFTRTAAGVVCFMLGYSRAGAVVKTHSFFGRGPGPQQILLDDVVCKGTELRLSDCRHKKWRSHNCGHQEDVGVVCSE